MLSNILNIFKKQPGPPESQIDRLTYAVGDIHGTHNLFLKLLDRIRADAKALGIRPRLILLGDYIDRGPESAKVLDDILKIEAENANGQGWCDLEVLLGNHEQAMMDFLQTGDGGMWLKHGGMACLTSYGIDVPQGLDLPVISEGLRSALERALPESHRELIGRMKLNFQAGDYFFVHAGVSPASPLAAQGPDTFLWIRGEFLTSPKACEYVVVYGHTPTYEPANMPWRIGVDTGAYETGILTAVRLLGSERVFLDVTNN